MFGMCPDCHQARTAFVLCANCDVQCLKRILILWASGDTSLCFGISRDQTSCLVIIILKYYNNVKEFLAGEHRSISASLNKIHDHLNKYTELFRGLAECRNLQTLKFEQCQHLST